MSNQTFADRLKEYRECAGMTQKELAKELDHLRPDWSQFPTHWIGALESGSTLKLEGFNVHQIVSICDGLGLNDERAADLVAHFMATDRGAPDGARRFFDAGMYMVEKYRGQL